MIEIQDKAFLAKTYFPRTTSGESSTYLLKLESELTQVTYEFSGLTDYSKSKNYYKFKFDASQVDDGEYNYYVIGEDNSIYATGLLRIGEVSQDLPEQYNYNPFTDDGSDNEIVQYYPHGNFKYRFQDKEITVIDNGEYIIKADEGYDALGEVDLTVDVPVEDYFESGYTEGFESGFTEGYDSGYTDGSQASYESGYTDGYQAGYVSGYTDGFESGFTVGYESGYTDGFELGYESGHTDGYAEGYEAGFQVGYNDGFAVGYASGYTDGYQSGKTDGIAEQKSKLVSTAVTENGIYTKEDGYNEVNVNVPVGDYYSSGYTSGKTDGINEQKGKLVSTAFTENGIYNKEDGYNQVTVDLPIDEYVQSGYTAGYTSGKTDGIDEQKSKLTSTAFTENGNYTREDGYSAVTVNVPVNDYYNSGYTSGYTDGHTSGVTDGIDYQKSRLSAVTLDENGYYTRTDGYSAITVNLPINEYVQSGFTSGYNSGKTDGVNEQKSKLSATTLTSNGIYTREDGYSAVTVSVPSDINNQNKSFSSTTNGDFEIHADAGYSGLGEVAVKIAVPTGDYFESGFTSGYTAGHTSGVTDGINEQKAKLTADTFTVNGTYTNADGYSAVTVNVEQTGYTPADMAEAYASGITSGVTLQKSKLITTAVTSNGTYSREDGYSEIVVNVSSGSIVNNQTKSISATTNGFHEVTYDYGYTGLENVSITVDVPTQDFYNSGYTSGYTDGYASGVTDGVAEQKGKLVSTAITQNGTYIRTDGYDEVYVNVTTGETGLYTLTVNITSNKLENLVNNASVTVSFLGSSTTETYTGSALQFSIYPGVSYTVSYATTEVGYIVPSSVSSTSTWKGSSTISGYFEYTIVPTSALTFDIISAGTIVWQASDDNYTKTISYSRDNGVTWTDITSSTAGTVINVNAAESIMFKGDNATYATGSSAFNSFSGASTAVFSIKGNIMSLVDSTGFTTATTLQSAYTFDKLFQNCSGLVDITELKLPAIVLTNECYSNMFNRTGISTVPSNCFPDATVLAPNCYSTMFSYCRNLTSVPSILPATLLEDNCYWMMFAGCTGLTSAPELPATTLATGCYQGMFYGCTSLTTAPELPATTLATRCYANMFRGCSSLNYIKCLATDISDYLCTETWVSSVAPTGTFVKDANMSSWTTGESGIPSNWTVQDAE